MKKLLLIPALSLMLLPIFAQAQYTDVLDDTAVELYGSTDTDAGDLIYIISSLISTIFPILGVILLLLVIYAGFLWMTAGGDAEQVKKAKTFMINAVVGLIILLSSYAIASYVIDALVAANLAT